jgi:ATP-dependent DNA helicase RecG
LRPELLNPLFAEVETLKGVGPQVSKQLAKLHLTRAVDLLFHLPTGAIERVRAPGASSVMLGRQVILDVTATEVRTSRGRGPTRVYAVDGEGNTLTLAFFGQGGWAAKQLPIGQKRTITGKLEAYGDEWQIVHPEVTEPGKAEPALKETIYPLTEGLTSRRVRELVSAALERAPDLAEWIEPSVLAREGWRDWRGAVAEGPRRPCRDAGSPPPRL